MPGMRRSRGAGGRASAERVPATPPSMRSPRERRRRERCERRHCELCFSLSGPPDPGKPARRSKHMASVAEPISAAFAPSRPAIKIVPVRALPIVAAVLVGLVVAIATDSRWALDFYHVAGGGLWTGIDLFLGLVLGPILGSMSIPSRLELS